MGGSTNQCNRDSIIDRAFFGHSAGRHGAALLVAFFVAETQVDSSNTDGDRIGIAPWQTHINYGKCLCPFS